jgi:hypothetical protein
MTLAVRGLVNSVVLIALGTGCDPVLNIAGSFFPAWMVAMVAGVALTAAARYIFAAAGLEAYLGPPVLIYTSLGLFLTVLTWLLLYRL